jgi:putative heme iron utilization protein
MAEQASEQAVAGAPAFDALGLAKSLLRATPAGALATIDAEGRPFSTLVTVATDSDGRPILLLSRLAAHTRHLEANGRCSLLLARIGRGDPLAHPRLTLLGQAQRLDRQGPDGVRVRRRFLAAHPKAELYADFGDFSFWRMDLSEAHLNGGFARAAQLSADDLVTDVSDATSLVAAEADALEHMNADHGDAIGHYATALLGAKPGRWRLSGLDPDGCDLAKGDDRRRLSFPERVTSPGAVRAMLVALAKEARAQADAAKTAA